jgi:hypothetical protein
VHLRARPAQVRDPALIVDANLLISSSSDAIHARYFGVLRVPVDSAGNRAECAVSSRSSGGFRWSHINFSPGTMQDSRFISCFSI